MAYSVYLGDQKLADCELGHCDPTMGVACAQIQPILSVAALSEFLLSRGAVDENGIIVVRNNPELVVIDSAGEKVGALFCYLQQCPLLEETWIDACGIHWQEYQERFGKPPAYKSRHE